MSRRPDDELRLASRVIHGGQRPEPETGAVVTPIFTSTTYAQAAPGVHRGFEYSRSHNPTRYALERMAGDLEGSPVTEEEDPSRGGFAFASGMAAMATLLELVDAGARVVAMDDLYGGSRRLLSQVRQRTQDLELVYADLSRIDACEEAMTPDTAMVWVETPTNPMMKLADLAAIAAVARDANPRVLLVCDNTFATPVNQLPLELGFDISMHSTTKYLNGHSDVVGGIAVVANTELAERVRFLQNAIGAVMGPHDAYLTLRGVKTLDVRMARHNANGLAVARFLEEHPDTARVLYPGLETHPQHALYRQQMRGGSGMVTCVLHGDMERTERFLAALRLFQLAESLGAVESLVNHPARMTHASVPPETRRELGIGDTLVRLSVGIEDPEDLVEDLAAALEA